MSTGTNLSDQSTTNGGTVNSWLGSPNGGTQGARILVRSTVANIPSSVAGYAVGCLLQASDTGGIYTNTGTAESCTFTLLEDAGGNFTLPISATDSTTTTGNSVAFTQNAVTSGKGFLQTVNGLTVGFGHSITHTTAVIANGGALQNLSSTSIDTSTTTGVLTNWSSTASLAGTQVLGTFSGLTTGLGQSLVTAALTTGSTQRLTGGGANMAAGGKVSEVVMGAATAGNGITATTTGVYVGTGVMLLTASSATTGVIAGVVTTSSNALVVGQAAATPAFQVDASTASQVTGLKVTGAATGGTVAVAVIQAAGNANLTIDALGTGTIGIGSVSTGAVTITPATTITGLATLTGGLTSVANAILKSGTAVPATAGAVAAGVPITMYSGAITIEVTSNAPTHARPLGSICINTGGNSTSTRMYINTNGSTTWTNFTTAA